jgi:hypothetical protein
MSQASGNALPASTISADRVFYATPEARVLLYDFAGGEA